LVWPGTVSCSGHGQCVNGTCRCDTDWTGQMDWVDFSMVDCVTYVPTRRALLIACVVSALLDMISGFLALSRIIRLGEWKWNFRKPTVPMKNVFWAQFSKLFLLPLLGLMLNDFYIIDQLPMLILLAIVTSLAWVHAVETNIRILRVALKPLKPSLYGRVRLAFIIHVSVMITVLIALHLALYWSPSFASPSWFGPRWLSFALVMWEVVYFASHTLALLPLLWNLIRSIERVVENRKVSERKAVRRQQQVVALKSSFYSVGILFVIVETMLVVIPFYPGAFAYLVPILYALTSLAGLPTNLLYFAGRRDALADNDDATLTTTMSSTSPPRSAGGDDTAVDREDD